MKLIFKQRMLSWFDSYDIYNESGTVAYVVKGELALGHCLRIFDAYGDEVGMVKERVLTFLPKFEMYEGENYIGCISKEFKLFKPRYNIDYNGWQIDGNWMEWDYVIYDENGDEIAGIYKEIFHLTDTYVIDVKHPEDALYTLMFVLAVDAEKCSSN